MEHVSIVVSLMRATELGWPTNVPGAENQSLLQAEEGPARVRLWWLLAKSLNHHG